LEAYKRVKANKGGEGVDGQSIAEFDEGLSKNLYKIWNRMASGSYFPPPVLRIEIAKNDGGIRPLGIPTVADRIAQMVAKNQLEPALEQQFYASSFGYRPRKSAEQAVGQARKNCWRFDWVLDLDIKGFFNNIDHRWMMKLVRLHTTEAWVLLYIERWLKAPVLMPDGTLHDTEKGTPQGGVISPLLANLFLHYAFDDWMARNNPSIPFERYADDAVCHCRSEAQAKQLLHDLQRRMEIAKLELHPVKTKIVYCKDDDRKGTYPHTSFTFLSYSFRARSTRNRWGKLFAGFSPAMSDESAAKIRQEIRDQVATKYTTGTVEQLAAKLNPKIRGWMNYFARYYKSRFLSIVRFLEYRLRKWAMRKYKRLRYQKKKVTNWWNRIRRQQPKLFVHWSF